MKYIVEKIGYKTIGVDDFVALKEDLNRLRDEVSSMRKELTKLKMQSIDDVQDIENNNMPVDQSAMIGYEQSMGLVFGDICFEKFTNCVESYNVFAKVDDCSLINENANVVSRNNSDLITFGPENQHIFFEVAHETIAIETSGIKVLEQGTDENANATVSTNEIVPAIAPITSAINASHSTEVSAEVSSEPDDQSTTHISWDQSKTSANDCSHSTEVEAEVNALACQSDGAASETCNTDETSDIQALEMIPEEHKTDESTSATESSNETIPSEMLQPFSEVSVEVDEGSDEQNSQSITDFSFDQSKTSVNDCSHSTDVEAEINISAGESIKSGCANETTTEGLLPIQVLEVILEEHETGEDMSKTLSSNDTISTEIGQSVLESAIIHSNEAAAAADLNIGFISSDENSEDTIDKSHETPDKSIETRESLIETEDVDQNNVSEITKNIEKMIRDCFIQNFNEMQAAKLPPSDSDDSEVKMSIASQSDEMVICNIYQQLPNEKVREMTRLNISDSAECFEINTTVRPIQPDNALLMESVEISDHEIEVIDNQIKMNIESVNQDSFQSSTSSSCTSSDGKTVVECNAQNELNEDCPDGNSDHDKNVPNAIEEIKARQFLRDDIETEFLLCVSSAAQRFIRTFPSK